MAHLLSGQRRITGTGSGLQYNACKRVMTCGPRCSVRNGGHRRCEALYLGIDFGTSGSRAIVVDENKQSVASTKIDYEREASADDWRRTLEVVLKAIPQDVKDEIAAIAINGTSGSALLCDRETGQVFTPPKMYYEAQSQECIEYAKRIAPKDHMTTVATSVLCKLIAWHLEGVWQQAQEKGQSAVLLHQADWIAANLHGNWQLSDYNNALKLGYDPGKEEFPDWLSSQEFGGVLPPVVLAPGTPIGPVTSQAAADFGLRQDCQIIAGTTDSVAAFLAADTREEGVAVTSLGSTLAVKLLSKDRIEDFHCGVYSQRLENVWLVGGASLTGGAVLKKYFTNEQLAELTERTDPSKPTGLDYYPLLCPGERFPVYDPNMQPRLEPRPDDDAVFLQGILEGMTRIEAEAYSSLASMGASTLRKVFTAGGGAKNKKWIAMREAKLGVPVIASFQAEAAYGSALLALNGAQGLQSQNAVPSRETAPMA